MTLEQKIAKAKAAGYSEEEIRGFLGKKRTTSASNQSVETPKPERSVFGKAYDVAGLPAEKAKEGLTGLTEIGTNMQNLAASKTGLPIGTEPTGNMARDVIAGTPKIVGETLSEVAPGFVDRTAIALGTAGAAVKGAGMVAGKVLPKVAPALEAGSGLQKGTLVEAFKDPKMIVDFGRKLRAQELYNEVKQGASVPKTLLEAKNVRIADKAIKNMAEGKRLTAPDAFHARKAVRALQRANQKTHAYNDDFLKQAEEGLTAMVFSSANKADKLYQTAIRGEQMRNFSRLNKNGTTGPISAAIMAKMPFLTPFLSPAVQGAGASMAGAAAQINPRNVANTSSLVAGGLDRLKAKKERNRGKR